MPPTVTIIGEGRVGGSLAQRLRDVGESVSVVHRSNFSEWLRTGSIGRILVIAVKDADLTRVIHDIAQANLNSKDDASDNAGRTLSGVVVFHVNGSLGTTVLNELAREGAKVGAAHPFQTFDKVDPTALDGVGWGVESDDETWPVLRDFIERTGGVAVRLIGLTEELKRIYHASAVAASNFSYAAYELGRRLADSAGIDPALFLIPIMRRTLQNAASAMQANEPFGVTGPLIRGDVEGVRKQLSSIPPELRSMYCYLSLALLEVVRERMDADVVDAMRDVLHLS